MQNGSLLTSVLLNVLYRLRLKLQQGRKGGNRITKSGLDLPCYIVGTGWQNHVWAMQVATDAERLAEAAAELQALRDQLGEAREAVRRATETAAELRCRSGALTLDVFCDDHITTYTRLCNALTCTWTPVIIAAYFVVQ